MIKRVEINICKKLACKIAYGQTFFRVDIKKAFVRRNLFKEPFRGFHRNVVSGVVKEDFFNEPYKPGLIDVFANFPKEDFFIYAVKKV